MTPTAHFDVIVVGGTLSATVTAALCAKRGLRGLVVDQGELASTRMCMLEDYVFGEDDSPAMKLVHSELALSDGLRRALRPVVPTLQAIYPDRRLDVEANRRHFVRDLRRAFGDDSANAAADVLGRVVSLGGETGAYLAEAGPMPATGCCARRAARRLLRRHPTVTSSLAELEVLSGATEEVRALLLAALPFATHVDARAGVPVAVTRFVRPVARLLGGMHSIEGDLSLRSLLLSHATRGRFEVIHDAVESIEPRGAALHVHLSQEKKVYTADYLVDASTDLSGLDTVPMSRKARRLAVVLQAAKPKGHLHALALEVDRASLPPCLASNVLLLNGRKQTRSPDSDEPEDRPILLLVRDPVSGADAARRASLIALHPVSVVEARGARMARLNDVIRARIQRLIPFLADAHPTTTAAPVLKHPLFDPDLDALTGIAGVAPKTPLKNVYVAGPVVLPGLGVEGQYMAALQAADAIDRRANKRKRPRKLGARMTAMERPSLPPPRA